MIRYDSLALWHSAVPAAWSRFREAGYYFSAGNLALADTALARAERLLDLSDLENREYNAYVAILDLLKDMKTNNVRLTEMDGTTISAFQNLTADSNGSAALTAKAIVSIVTNIYGFNCVDMPVAPLNPAYRMAGTGAATRMESPNAVTATPNPASDFVTFSYQLPLRHGSVVMTISDVSGRKVYSYNLDGHDGKLRRDVKGLAPEIYLYTVRDSRRKIADDKVVVQ